MRTKLIESNKPEHYIHAIRNVDTTPAAATIPVGSPLILNLSATPQPPVYTNGLPAGWEDGLQVVLPASAGASNVLLFAYGVAMAPIIFQQLGETMVHGVCQAAYVRGTRSATTASWASSATSSVNGFTASIDTVNNVFAAGTASATGWQPYVILDNFATAAGSATNATDTRTAVTALLRTFVRIM